VSERPGRRPAQRPRTSRPSAPPIPDGVDWYGLDADSRRELRGLPKDLAERVGAHLVAAGLLLDDDPPLARRHALEARRLASRVPVVREAAGLAAYHDGDWAEALAELRAYRRMAGDDRHLPLMADCERALGRPERALELATAPEAARLDPAGRVELRVVAAGARRDLGQLDAALLVLSQTPGLRGSASSDPLLRARYAYADALQAAGRDDEARRWFSGVADQDVDQVTDAAERLLELDGVAFLEEPMIDADRDAGPGRRG
jgi:tetratricopeptide (TPR) repeat protein